MLYRLDDEVVSLHTKETLTDGIGTFSFTLPTAKDVTQNLYNDVALYDKAKLWINYDSITGDPLTVGPICQTQASVAGGFMRTFLCKNQGEILTRRFKTKNYVNVDASTIIAEWASDLGLGLILSGDASDAYHESFFFDHDSYFDCLRVASDFWVDSTHQVKKDFFVDVGDVGHPLGHLVWKTRPIRTVGVETLTMGANINAYTVQRDLTSVKNYLWIYGRNGKIQYDTSSKLIDDGRKNPTDGDAWTESITDWTAVHGVLSAPSADPVVGTYNILCFDDTGATRQVDFYRTITETSAIGLEGYQSINFWLRFTDTVTNQTLRLFAPDSSNYFVLSLASPTSWTRYSFILGPGNEYNAISNPTGQWHVGAGAPSWYDIHAIAFYAERAGDFSMHIDGLYFGHGRWRSVVQDATSQTDYGIRELTHVDDKLESDVQCQQRGESLQYQLKLAPTRLDVTTIGNLNLLIGDRLTMTIPQENISAAPYDVVTVEHSIDLANGFITKASMLNSSNIREVPAITTGDVMIQQYKRVREITRDIRTNR
jgi:hypothetical protein